MSAATSPPSLLRALIDIPVSVLDPLGGHRLAPTQPICDLLLGHPCAELSLLHIAATARAVLVLHIFHARYDPETVLLIRCCQYVNVYNSYGPSWRWSSEWDQSYMLRPEVCLDVLRGMRSHLRVPLRGRADPVTGLQPLSVAAALGNVPMMKWLQGEFMEARGEDKDGPGTAQAVATTATSGHVCTTASPSEPSFMARGVTTISDKFFVNRETRLGLLETAVCGSEDSTAMIVQLIDMPEWVTIQRPEPPRCWQGKGLSPAVISRRWLFMRLNHWDVRAEQQASSSPPGLQEGGGVGGNDAGPSWVDYDGGLVPWWQDEDRTPLGSALFHPQDYSTARIANFARSNTKTKAVVDVLCNRGASFSLRDRFGRYPIHVACWKHDAIALEVILNRSYSQEERDHRLQLVDDVCQATPLLWLFYSLLERPRSSDGSLQVDWRSFRSCLGLIFFHIAKYDLRTGILINSASNRLQGFISKLRVPLHGNQVDKWQRSALWLAILLGVPSVVEDLLRAGRGYIDVDQYRSFTPLPHSPPSTTTDDGNDVHHRHHRHEPEAVLDSGDTAEVLLGGEADEEDGLGEGTALMMAIRLDRWPCVQHLLRPSSYDHVTSERLLIGFASWAAVSERPWNPYASKYVDTHRGPSRGSRRIPQLIVACDPNHRDNEGRTALMIAMMQRGITAWQLRQTLLSPFMLVGGSHLDVEMTEKWNSILLLAPGVWLQHDFSVVPVTAGQHRLIQREDDRVVGLQPARVWLDAVDNDGWTALMYAVQAQLDTVVELLIVILQDADYDDNHGATVNRGNEATGHPSSLEQTRSNAMTSTAKLGATGIQRQGDSTSPGGGSGEERLRYGRLTLPCHIIDMQDKEGRTALMLAAQGGNEGILRALIHRGGARMDLKDRRGHDAAWYADRYGHAAQAEEVGLIPQRRVISCVSGRRICSVS